MNQQQTEHEGYVMVYVQKPTVEGGTLQHLIWMTLHTQIASEPELTEGSQMLNENIWLFPESKMRAALHFQAHCQGLQLKCEAYKIRGMPELLK